MMSDLRAVMLWSNGSPWLTRGSYDSTLAFIKQSMESGHKPQMHRAYVIDISYLHIR